ncbi:TPA: hypothetical protein ACNOIS_006057, partial [Klebsiella oxytoca]
LTMLKNTLAEGSLISNGGMDVDLSFWENSGTGSAFTYDAGEKALRTTTGSVRVANVTRIPAEAGLTLTVSFEYKTSETMNSVSSDTVGVITDLGNPVAWLSSESPWLSGVTTSWQTKTVELTIPADFTGNYVYLRFAAGGWAPSNSARLYIRKVDVFSSTGVSKKANASAVTDLTSRVDSAEGKLASHSQAITKLQNDLTTTNSNVSKKADQSALTSLTGRVEKTESGLTAANSNITSLSGSINTLRNQGSNPWFDGSLESYADGQQIGGAGATVVSSQKYSGMRSLRLRRNANESGNSDKQIGSWAVVRAQAVYRFELWAMMPAGQAPSSGWSVAVGLQCQDETGSGNTWPAAIIITENALEGRDRWAKFTGNLTVPAGKSRAVIWMACRGAIGTGTPGYDLYADNIVITDITDAKAAQDTASAAASAVDYLTTTVSQQVDTLSSIGNRTTMLENGLKTINSTISQKADASGLQTLQNTVTEHAKTLTSQGSSLTKLDNSLSTTQNNVAAMQDDAAASAAVIGNMLVNSGFELGSKRWTVSGAATFTTALAPHSGSKIVRCGTGKAAISQRISV